MPTVSELQVVVGADVSGVSKGLAQANSEVSGFGSKLAGVGGLVATGIAAAGAAIAAGVAVGVKAAGDLEQSVANISTIKPEIDTSAVFASLNEMSTRIPQSAAQLGDSLYNIFSSLDVNTEGATQLLETFAKGAVGAQTDAQTFGTAIMGVMNAYGLSVSDAAHVSDVFFNTVNKGVVTGEELASSLGPVTQAAKSAGVGIDQLGAMIAAVTKEGGPAAQNINNLNNFLQKVSTGPARTELEKLGIATTQADGSLRQIPDVLTDLKAKLAGMSQSEAIDALQHIFPDAQARQGAQTLLSQLDLVKSATLDNANAVGVADSAYQKMNATFNSQSKLLMNTLMSILTTVGAELLPVITPLVTAFAQALPGAFQAAQAAVAPLAAAIAQLWASFSDSGALQVAIDGFNTIRQVFAGDWSPDASINPIVNALGMLATFIRDYVMPAVSTVAGFIISQFGVVVSWVQANWPLIQQTIQTVLDAISAFWATWGGTIVTVVQSAWTIISTTISTGLQVALGIVKALMQAFNGDWSGAWDTLVGVAGTALSGLGTIVQAAWDAIFAVLDTATGGMLTKVTTWISDTEAAISAGMTAVSTAISDGWNGVSDFIGGILPAIRDAIMTVWNAIPEDIRADLVLIATHLVTQGAVWVTNLTTAGSNMLTAIQTALTNMVTAVTTWATSTFLAPITGLVTTAGTAASNVGSSMLEAIRAKLGEIVSTIQTWADSTFLAPLRGLIATAGSVASQIGQAIVDGIANSISAGAGAIRDAAYRAARSALDAAKSALGVPGVEGRAIGGPVSALRPYLVGEMGPEMFVPKGAGTIIPAGMTAAMLRPSAAAYGGGGGTVVNVTLAGPVYGFDDFARRVNDAVTSNARGGRIFR